MSNNWKAFRLAISNFYHEMCKVLKSCTKLVKLRSLSKFFGGELAPALWQKLVRKVYLIAENILKSIAKHAFLSLAFNLQFILEDNNFF